MNSAKYLELLIEMTDQPLEALITIGIPFRNERPEHFQDAVRSVFSQNYSNWELILIGDGASDQLTNLAREIKDSRVMLTCHDRSAGLASTLNEIAAIASGELLFRMDADDIMHPEQLGHNRRSLQFGQI